MNTQSETPGLSSLPDLRATYEVSPEQITSYRENGHVLLRGVMSQEEVGAYRDVVVNAALRHSRETRPLEERDTYGKAFLQVTNLWEVDDLVKKFVLAPRFGKIAAVLLEAEAVRLYHDQALFKEPGGGHTPWHQDQYYWPLDCLTVTMWMPLVDASTEKGTMSFADGSHHEGYLGPIAISDQSEEHFRRYLEEKGYQLSTAGEMRAGDATFHSGWTLHAAPGNKTDSMREVMTIIYYPDGAMIIEPDHENRVRDMERWFPGQKPGERAASLLNPVVWPV